MEFDLQWLLVGLPVAFALGWLASRLDIRQLKREQRETPRAYFKGLGLLLNEQQDKAIDAFIEAVQNDPDTTDLHFALGSLFRRRGEFERSVRVHQHLLDRADLPAAERQRAQHALAQDFMKAGLFDRAEQAYQALLDTRFDSEARLALLDLYERSRDWPAAANTAAALEQRGMGAFGHRIAHHCCEMALEAAARGQPEAAASALQRARQVAPNAPRPLLLAGQRALLAGQATDALALWSEMRLKAPETFPLVADEFAVAALASGQLETARHTLVQAYAQAPGLELLAAIAKLDGTDLAHAAGLLTHVQQQPTLSGAQALVARPAAEYDDPTATAVRAALAKAARPLQRYRCAACGFEGQRYFWQCPGCLGWDSFPTRKIEDL